jgi:hypothetical protein
MARHVEGRDLRQRDQGDHRQQDEQDGEHGQHQSGQHQRDQEGQDDQAAAGGPPAAPATRTGRVARTSSPIERIQTGVRMEKRLVKVLKALAELYDLSLGDLLEGIVLHAFEGRSPFSAPSLRRIAELARIYGLDVEPRAGARPFEAVERPVGS